MTAKNPLGKGFNPKFSEFLKSLQKLPKIIREVLIFLGNQGWYLDLQMSIPFILKLKRGMGKDNFEDLENALIEHFDDRLDQIEAAIVKGFPNREKIINAAFSVHRRGDYLLSIPVLLAQADGICKEVLNKSLFLTRERLSIKDHIQDITVDTFQVASLSLLSDDLPISLTEKKRGIEFNELNRHMVLHGESLDYGTKTNSLKAISFINYMALVLQPEPIP